jgi:hypothetical protein
MKNDQLLLPGLSATPPHSSTLSLRERRKTYDKKYREKNKEKIKQQKKEYDKKRYQNYQTPEYKTKKKDYYQQNREKILQRQKAGYQKNRNNSEHKKKAKKYYQQNREKILQRQKAGYQKNNEKYREYQKEYQKEYAKNNSDKIKQYYQNPEYKKKAKEYYQNNKENILQRQNAWYEKIKHLKNWNNPERKIKTKTYEKTYKESLKNDPEKKKRYKENYKKYYKKYYEKHREKILQRNRERSKRPEIREKNKKRKKEYRKKDPAKWNQISNQSKKKRLQNDLDFRLYCKTSADLYQYLKKVKQSKYNRTFNMLGYSVQNLREHVEKEMKPGMTWQNFGRNGWHIEHKVPKSIFQKISTFTDCEQTKQQIMRECWSLSNLTTMIGNENISKSDILYENYRARYIEKIQDITTNPGTINYLQNHNPVLLQICINIEKQENKQLTT